ncbi:sensor histidine kinase [Rufibacter hautae]|uniref:Histidine kinase n=1 Tax=Rufibacter hautae TaxID=2595005 RepID=A0A5B6TBC0_9BACT|nr:histidine kinase [Rufibacter hautae]KAA3436433.1 histidine kinase [Rufibacter hautae]
MKKSRTLLYHLAAWGLYIGYSYLEAYISKPTPFTWMYLLFLTYFTSLALTFYFCYSFVYPRFLKREKVIPLVLCLVFAPFLFAFTRYFLEEMMYPVLFGFRNYGADTTFSYYLTDNLFRAFPMMAISAVVWNVQDAFRKEKEYKILRAEKTQAELAFLKSQVNPHFLYNTLNYMYAQAYPVSEKLADAILKLSDMMRYMLHDNPDGKVELQKEVEYLRSFIHIFRLRFEDNFFVDFQVDGHVDGQRVASLVLIPFVENAFKHGVVNDPANPVQIRLQMVGKDLRFEVRNRINRQEKDHSTGIGLVNIKRRLELLYPNQHQLTISNGGATHEARLELRNL